MTTLRTTNLLPRIHRVTARIFAAGATVYRAAMTTGQSLLEKGEYAGAFSNFSGDQKGSCLAIYLAAMRTTTGRTRVNGKA